MHRDVEIAIIGGGIAGLSAAMAVARLGHEAVLLSDGAPGGELVKINRIDGIPGHEGGIAGYDLCPITHEQAEELGAKIHDRPATSIAADGDRWLIGCEGGDLSARAVILATGTSLASLDIPGITDFEGKGVSDCASCDAPLLRGKRAVVAGGGDSAMQEALVLAESLEEVILVTKGAALGGQKAYVDAVEAEAKITCRFSTEPVAVLGDGAVSSVRVRDMVSGAETEIDAEAIFAFTGLVPNTGLVSDTVDLDPTGRVAVDLGLRSSARGIAAVGNVRQGSPHRAAAAMGDAAAAAASVHAYLADGSWR